MSLVSKLGYTLLTGLMTYLYIYRGEITHLLSTMDIPVGLLDNPQKVT